MEGGLFYALCLSDIGQGAFAALLEERAAFAFDLKSYSCLAGGWVTSTWPATGTNSARHTVKYVVLLCKSMTMIRSRICVEIGRTIADVVHAQPAAQWKQLIGHECNGSVAANIRSPVHTSGRYINIKGAVHGWSSVSEMTNMQTVHVEPPLSDQEGFSFKLLTSSELLQDEYQSN